MRATGIDRGDISGKALTGKGGRAMKLPQFHWHRFPGPGFPVSMPGLRSHQLFRWNGIHGVQIGRWFIGAIQGDRVLITTPDAIRAGAEGRANP